MTTSEWTDKFGANIRDVPEEVIEEFVKKWVSENDTDWIPDDLINEDEILRAINNSIGPTVLMARVKEFHAVEVEARTRGLNLYSNWLSSAGFGECHGDNATPFRVIDYLSLLEDLVKDIMSEDVRLDYHEEHRNNLRKLRSFASSILKALDDTPFK